MDWLEKLPNTIKEELLAGAAALGVPAELLPFLSAAITIAPILSIFPLLFALTTVFERKGLARIQNRYGPNRVGIPFTNIRMAGFGQFIADGIKSLTKEDIVPRAADGFLHFLAPVVLAIPIILTFSVLPFGRHLVPIEIEAGLLFFFAVGGMAELAIFMAGWSSRNKYSLLGAMRAIAQMISYELPLILSTVVVVMATGSMSPVDIVERQAHSGGLGISYWNIFTPWGLVGGVLFFIAMLAEANRSPFDLPEGESELVAGYFTEYSGFKFALFFMAEYLGLFAAMGMGITLFLGGWSPPINLAPFTWLPTWGWFMLKLLLGIFLIIWIRGTMPRMRMDQLMKFAWKFMLPLSVINILVFGAVYYLESVAIQWAIAIAVLGFAWQRMGIALAGQRPVGVREYRFAD
jgi:NADH-quinone oxidoreductase subunit H